MADKRISQLVERVTLLNNDVFPIVASGATTTNKVTLQTIDDYMQTNLDFGVTSVAMTVPTGLSVTGTPITSTGTFVVTFTAGYSIPTNAKQTQWDTAYSNRIVSVTAPITFASNVLGITQSGASSDGYLSSTDWNTFNNKQGALTFGNLTEATSSVLTITGGTGAVIGSGTSIEVKQASGTQDGFLDSADWTTFNGKQNALTGTGIVKSTGGTITYLTDNTSNWDSAYNDKINSAAVTGTTTKTLTLTQQDGGTITTTWTDLVNPGTVTSVGVSMPSAFSVANSPITSSGTIAITGAGTISQYIDGTGALQTFPSGLPPTGAAGGDLTGTYPNPTVHRIHGIDFQNGTPTADDVWVYGGSPAKWQHQKLHSNQVTEDGNLFYTDARARASISESVTGLDYNSTTGVFSTSAGYGIPTTASQTNWDAAYNDKINSAAVTGTTTKTLTLTQQDGGTITASWTDINTDAVTSVFGRTGAVVATSGDYNTDQVTEGASNLYFTNARSRSSISLTTTGTSGAATYNSTTGVLNIPSYVGGVTSVNTLTGAVVLTTSNIAEGTNLYYTNARARGAISLTTTGTSGAATYDSATGVLNVPNYAPDLSGYVTLGTAQTISGAKTFSNFLNVQYNNTGEPLINARFGNNTTNGIGGVLVSGEAQAHIRFLVGSQTWDGAGAKQWQIRVGAGNGADTLKIYSWTKGDDTMTIANNGNTTIHGTISATNLSGTNTGDQTLAGLGGLSNDPDSEQTVGSRAHYWNNGVGRINGDPRWNESGYDADLGCLHLWSTTAGGANYGRFGLAFYNGTDYQYLTTKASQNNLFVNNNAILHAGNYTSFAVPTTRSITINGTTQDLSANRTWNITASATWSGLTGGYRQDYDLGFRPQGEGSYAGFRFATPGNDADAGYLLIRGGADSDVYTENGITLVADKGWVTLAQRTTADKGIRLMTGAATSVTRFTITEKGHSRFNIIEGGSNSSDRVVVGDGSTGTAINIVSYPAGGEAYNGAAGIFIAGGRDALVMANNASIRFVTGGYTEVARCDNGQRFLVGFTTNQNGYKVQVNGSLYTQTNVFSNGPNHAQAYTSSNARVSRTQDYPLGHYHQGDEVFSLDPTWSNAQLQDYFNSGAVQWVNDSTAPGGYAIQVSGPVNVASGPYDSGFPYIPVESSDDVFYMECWIKSIDVTNGHYMGSVDYNQSFTSLGGNPGSFGYWVMSGSQFSPSGWNKVAGYISGFGVNTGQFAVGTKYWTPQALFNYSGQGTSYISGWKAIKVSVYGARYFRNSIYSNGDVVAYFSDRRLKNIVGNVDNAIEKIKKLNGVYYKNNELANQFGYKGDDKQLGLIAQEVNEIAPEVIKLAPFDTNTDANGQSYSKSGDNYLTIQYEKLVPLLIEGIKEQQKQIDELKNLVNALTK